MKIATTLSIFTIIAVFGVCGEPIDAPLQVARYDDVFQEINRLRGLLPWKAADDLAVAVREIERTTETDTLPEISASERKAALVLLVNNRSPRELILLGACLLLARSQCALDVADALGSEERQDELARNAQFWSSKGSNLLKDYIDPNFASPTKARQ